MKISRIGSGASLVILRLALLATAFYIAYRGQRLLETPGDLRTGGLFFLAAAFPLCLASFLGRGGRISALPAEPEHLPQPQPVVPAVAPPVWRRQRAWAAEACRLLASNWVIVAIMALAIALRFYKLGSLPAGITFDEAQNGLEARRILHDPLGYHPIFIPGVSQLPALFFYVFAGAMRILGENIFALRTTTAVFGILTVGALFLLGRELFGARVGALAALLLAVMRWHLNFSRIAYHGIFGPLFMVLALYFLLRGLKGRGWVNYAVSGLLLGIGLQSYYAFTLVPLVVVVFWLHHLVFEGRRRMIPLVGGLLLVGVTSFIVVLPLLRYVNANPDASTRRAETTSITTNRSASEVRGIVFRSTKKHALMFNVRGDNSGRHNLPPLPMLDRYTAMFFLLGIVLAFIRPHDPRYFLLLVWLAVLVQPGIWSVEGEAPQAYRTLMVTPVVALLAALPLALLADIALDGWSWSAARDSAGGLATRARRFLSSNLLGGAAALGLLFFLAQVTYLNFNTFFNKQLDNAYVWSYFEPAETIVGRGLARLDTSATPYSSSTISNPPTALFLAPDAPRTTTIVLPDALPFQEPRDAIVFLDGRDQRDSEAFHWIRALYPNAQFSEYHPPGVPEITVVHEAVISADLISQSFGVDGTYAPRTGAPVTRREAGLKLDWRARTPALIPFTARWETTLKVTRGLENGLRVEAPGRVRLVIDAVPVAEGDGAAEVRDNLALGLHDLTIEAEVAGLGEVRLLALNSEAVWQDVPANALFRLPLGAHGLTGTYYSLTDRSAPLDPAGPPVERRVDPYVAYRYHVSPIKQPGGPFTVVWTGKLTVPEPGGYRLLLDNRDDARLLVDGQVYLAGIGRNEGTEPIPAGVHQIELRYAAYTAAVHVLLFWIPPGQPPVIVPFQALRP